MKTKRREARFWEKTNGRVRCGLCSHRCTIQDKHRGICGVREAEKGELYTLIYGRTSSVAVDPVEKKPLYHFKPGSRVLSLGTVGCNFRCLHCQNSGISCATPESHILGNIKPKEVVDMAVERNCSGIAWTYNEPTIWYEFTYETSILAKENGLDTMYITNGYITPEALEEHAPYLDAMNIDVKAFTEEFYRKIAGARLQPVLDTCILAKHLEIHTELTYLVIPGFNDSPLELQNFTKWVLENMGPETPIHFSRFHPDYKMQDVSPTPAKTLDRAYETAKEQGIYHVYIGNVRGDKRENTYCHKCGSLCINRVGFRVVNNTTQQGKCPNCGEKLHIKQ